MLKEADGMEIQRIYVLAEQQGHQIGKELLKFAMCKASQRGLNYVWLDVWEKNTYAIRFYEKNGFSMCSKHTFPFDEEIDSHWLMRKELHN